MKSQYKSRHMRRPHIRPQSDYQGYRNALNPLKPLLKASTALPAHPVNDDPGSFVLGYN